MTSARQYHAPLQQSTGRLVYQARVRDTQTSWYFDAQYNYQETGFLDAPDRIPTGSVRAMDLDRITLGIDSAARDAQVSA